MMARVLVIALVACGSAQRPAPKPPAITVQDAGTEPRRVLRYELPPDAVERFEMDVKTRTSTAVTNTVLETGHRDLDFPTVQFLGQLSANKGRISEEILDATPLEDVTDPTLRELVDHELRAVKGTRASWSQAPSGLRSDISVQAKHAERFPDIAEWVEANAVVFPDSPIGVGAIWRQDSQIVAGRATYDRTVTYTLTALDDEHATITATAHLAAAPQALRVEPNATYELTHAAADDVGEFKIAFHHMVATTTSHGTSDVSMSIVRKQLRLSSTIQSETTMTVRPR